jgi:hypothetical protein
VLLEFCISSQPLAVGTDGEFGVWPCKNSEEIAMSQRFILALGFAMPLAVPLAASAQQWEKTHLQG